MTRIAAILIFLSIISVVRAQQVVIKTDWVFIYYMPYDNNLSKYGEPIIDMIKDSLTSDNVVVTVQADFSDTAGMVRYIITQDSIFTSIINNESSSNTSTYSDYLRWVKSNVISDKTAVIFLNHGGKLNELCMDEYPEYGFLEVDSVKNMLISEFPYPKIDLLFLQVCVKGSIEPIYELKNVADYTLCSQHKVGAPNAYYHYLFSNMSDSIASNGFDVAKIIVENEAATMFNSYTLIDNSQLDSLHYYFKSFLAELKSCKKLSVVSVPASLYYNMEKYWDLISFLENLKLKKHSKLYDQRKNLIEFIENKVILIYKISPGRSNMNSYCGISMSASQDSKYDFMDFYGLLQPLREIKIKNQKTKTVFQ